MNHQIICSDNKLALSKMQENSFDSCITDPPYGMNIADVGWDHCVPDVDTWRHVYRVIKPGAFVLSFCSPEFYHRMAVNVEDAGFRPLDMVVWIVTTKMAKKNRLKPAHEPIFVAQKPLEGSIEKNYDKWGCGKINTTTTRIPWDKEPPTGWIKATPERRGFGGQVARSAEQDKKELVDADPTGRYPSDIIGYLDDPDHQRYFYAPRVSRRERKEYNDHPTPKPISLMRYLCRVYTPLGGKILDPFVGSGSTAIAALQEGCNFVGIDSSQHYCDIAERRVVDYLSDPVEKLFEYE